jgi:hypothetical protein
VPDGRLSISITKPDDRVIRLGPDEVDAAMVPGGLSFGSQMPGGYATASTNLLLRIDLESPVELGDRFTVHGPGGETAWDGLITALPRSHGDSYGITLNAVGFSSSLGWDPTFTEVYMDRDPASWTEPPFSRKVAVAGTEDHSKIQASSSAGGLLWEPPAESLPTSASRELHYAAPTGTTVGLIAYQGTRTGFTNFEAPNLFSSANENITSSVSQSLTLDSNINGLVLTTPARYLMLRAKVAVATTPGAGEQQRYTKIGVIGSHGVSLRSISGDLDGVYASDVIAHILSQTAPELTYTTGADGSIVPSTFPIPHLAFKDPVTAEDAILTANAFHVYEWGVYDDKEFFWRPTDPDRCCWEARLSEGAHLDLEGPQAADTYNGVYVSYTDPAGTRMTVGPPGATADATSSALADTSEDNPLNKWGRTKWARLDISQVTTQIGATQLGSIWLGEQAVPQRRGTITVKGTIQHPTRGLRPTWAVKAGDYVRISDHPADQPRRIVSVSYSHDSREVRMEVGSSPYKLDSLLQRLNVASVGRY